MGKTTHLNWCSPDFWTINLESQVPYFKAIVLVLGVKLPKKIGHLAFQEQYKSPWDLLRSGRFWTRFFPSCFHDSVGLPPRLRGVTPTNLDANTRHARQRTHIFADRSFWRRARESACHSKVKNMWKNCGGGTHFFGQAQCSFWGQEKKGQYGKRREMRWKEMAILSIWSPNRGQTPQEIS